MVASVYAQQADTVAAANRPVVSRVRFEGNTRFADEQLRLRVRTEGNRRFLGIPGFTWWRWVYDLGASGALGKRVGGALMASGEAPSYLDTTLLAADVERLQAFYEQEGFRDAHVASDVDTLQGGKRVHVTFRIEPGPATYVRRITYEGLQALAPEQRYRLARGTLLRTERPDPQQPLQLEAQGQRYSEPTLHEERRRLLTFLRNAGFATVTRDSIRAFVFPRPSHTASAAPDSFDITFRIHTGSRFRFGDIHFDVTGPERTSARTDTLLEARPDSLPSGHVTVQIKDERRLEPGLLARTMQLRPGDWYEQSALLATRRRLEGSGLFTYTDIVPQLSDTVWTDSASYLPHRIELRTRPRHRIRFETFMLQRSGVLGTSDSELGTGIGITYENVNLFGGGETFRLRTTGSVAVDADSTLFTSTQAEVTASLTYPYLIAPFRRLDRWLHLYDARTRFSLSLLTARRDALRLVIRGRGTARLRLEMQHASTITSFVDVLDLSLSNPDTLAGFNEQFLARILDTLDDPVQQAQIMEDYTQPQINNALRYTFRSARVNPLRRRNGYSYEAAVEWGGNLPYVLDRFVFSPDTLEGSLPGLPLFRGDRTGNRLIYRQYLRLTGDLRRYHPLSERAVLAWRIAGGFAHPTGRSNVVPFDRRFYSGGAAGVRGWRLRQLGPGAASFTSDSSATGRDFTNLLGGDIKLEASIEWRQTFLRNVLAADWLVVPFIDVGNVWFGPRNPGFGREGTATRGVRRANEGRFELDDFYRQLGVGTGLGLRLAWDYLIVRFDLAVRAYDPAQADRGWFPQELQTPILHFGIGHTF